MGFFLQLKLLVWKNFTLKKRRPVILFTEILIPLTIFLIMVFFRLWQPPQPIPTAISHPLPLPSAGLLPILLDFCAGDQGQFVDESEFQNARVERIHQFLEKLNSIEEKYDLRTIVQCLDILKMFVENFHQFFEDILLLHEHLYELFSNRKDITNLLSNKLSVAPEVVNQFLDSSLNSLKVTELLVQVVKKFAGNMLLAHNNKSGLLDAYMDAYTAFLNTTRNSTFMVVLKKFVQFHLNKLTPICTTAMKLKSFTQTPIGALFEVFCHMNADEVMGILSQLIEKFHYKKIFSKLQSDNMPVFHLPSSISELIHTTKQVYMIFKLFNDLTMLNKSLPLESCSSADTSGPSEKNLDDSGAHSLLKSWIAVQTYICNKDMSHYDFDPDNLKNLSNIDSSLLQHFKEKQFKIKLIFHSIQKNARILYAPNNTDADMIIRKANETFKMIDHTSQFVRKFISIIQTIRTYNLKKLTQNNIDIFLQMFQKIFFSFIHPSDAENYKFLKNLHIDKSSVLLQLEEIENMACHFVSLTSKLPLNIFMGFRNEAEAITYLSENAYSDNKTVIASITFAMNEDGSLPKHLTYSIRQNATLIPSTLYMTPQMWAPPSVLEAQLYYKAGFVWIQDLIDRAFISLHSNRDVIEPANYIQEFPKPCYISDKFVHTLLFALPLGIILIWVYTVAILVHYIVSEKENRLKEVMKTMGMTEMHHWLSWLVTSGIQLTVTSILLTIIIKTGNVLPNSNWAIIFLVIESFVMVNIASSFLISSIFSKAKLAAACTGIVYFMAFIPYTYVSINEDLTEKGVSIWKKFISCLFSTSAFGLVAKEIAYHELSGEGLQWNNWNRSIIESDEFGVRTIICIILLDVLIYCMLSWYIQNVHPGTYGLPRPWYFPFTKTYWLGQSSRNDNFTHTRQNDSPKFKNSMDNLNNHEVYSKTNTSHYFEREPTHLPLGISIISLFKVYQRNKIAVNGLSLNFYEGQITSILGHNGAGKTTTMSILTGLMPPTSGTAYIYGLDIRTHMPAIRKNLGICPQHNVLFDKLTVEEHLWLYCRLKGMSSKATTLETERVISDIDLLSKRHQKVECLAGGMKRKLSIAIAFAGGSQTIILDEPTAGVDPYSRRAIWNLILKYKKGRTILLSTHHMDEAEILSDRIAVIANGQLQCCGSALFLKSHLGMGYHLHLVKEQSSKCDDTYSADSGMDVELAQTIPKSMLPSHTFYSKCCEKLVTEFIQQCVPTAFLVSETLYELHYILPLAELRKGNFEKLFQTIDEVLPHLQIQSYGVKNTTLEEVFLKVTTDCTSILNNENCDDMQDCLKEMILMANLPINTNQSFSVSQFKSFPVTRNNFRSFKSIGGVAENLYSRMTEIGAYVNAKDSNLSKLYSMQANAGLGNGSSTKHFKNQVYEKLPVYDSLEIEFSPFVTTGRAQGCPLWQMQLWAILNKRFLCTKRSVKGIITQVILPAFFMAVAMTVALMSPKVAEPPPLELSPLMYSNYSLPTMQFVPFANYYQDVVTNRSTNDASSMELEATFLLASGLGGSFTVTTNVTATGLNTVDQLDGLLKDYRKPSSEHSVFQKKGYTDTHSYHPICQCASDFSGLLCSKDYKNPPAFHTSSGEIMLNISGDNVMEYLLNTGTIHLNNRFGAVALGLSRHFTSSNFGQDPPAFFRKIVVNNAAKVWYDSHRYHSLPAFLNVLNNAILRANLPPYKGDPATFGITTISHPLQGTSFSLEQQKIIQGTDFIIALFILVAMSFVPASFVLFLVTERHTKSKHLQMLSGAKPHVYWIGNYCWDFCNSIIPAIMCIIILLIYDVPAYTSKTNLPAVIILFFLYGWSMTPVMYPVSFVFQDPSIAYVILIITNMFIGTTTLFTDSVLQYASMEDESLEGIAHFIRGIFLIFPNYCLGKSLMLLSEANVYNMLLEKAGRYEEIQSPWDWDIIPIKLLSMAFSGVTFFLFTLLCEKLSNYKTRKNVTNGQSRPYSEDSDVASERKRVLAGGAKEDILRLQELTKVYNAGKLGDCLAVDQLSIGIRTGECFGLLGVNGAGKTTTFKMLTGDTFSTSGDAFVNGFSINDDLQHVQSMIGYCPQFDALYDELTARELLTIYSCFRGIPSTDQDQVVNWAIQKLDLVPYADCIVGTYSGGNRRKLATAVALLGNPAIIYLDEPSTGMDPHSRRFLWNTILNQVRNGQSVMMSSHSMEECETLCSRLAIMIGGRFRCLGSVQHLKNKFGGGYCIGVHVKNGNFDAVIDFFRNAFPGSTIKEQHHNVLHYKLKPNNVSLAYMFSCMEEALHHLPIADYSICQNTLDNVFINFVKLSGEAMEEELTKVITSNSEQDTSKFKTNCFDF